MLIGSLFFLISCSKSESNKKDTSDLYKKSQTSAAIIERSGTLLTGNSADDRQEILDDAQNRLRTGGGLFGKKGGLNLLSLGKEKSQSFSSIGIPINPYLWKASLETIDFMPLSSADPFAGIIITDWYSSEIQNERCKLNIFIKGLELKTENLKVSSFCQSFENNSMWVNKKINVENNIEIENAILNKAKKIKLSLN